MDLHIYILPLDRWIPYRRLAKNKVVDETISAGFVRVSPMTTLAELRGLLPQQLGCDTPQYYVFIKSVGRNFTQVNFVYFYLKIFVFISILTLARPRGSRRPS